MHIKFMKTIGLTLIFLVASASCNGSHANASSNHTLIWKIEVSKYELKSILQSTETVTQYNGAKTEIQHQQSPASGDVYIIMDITITKIGADSVPFDWAKLSIQDQNGTTFQRSSNDTFLEQYSYTPRITGLEIRFGVNEGWLCYEIPTAAANEKLTLIYTADGSQQEIVVKN